jgi:hypothetical protein
MNVAQAKELTAQTAEGVTSYAPVLELARKYGVEMPITEVVGAVISGRLSVGDAGIVLMSRSAKPEWYGTELRARGTGSTAWMSGWAGAYPWVSAKVPPRGNA